MSGTCFACLKSFNNSKQNSVHESKFRWFRQILLRYLGLSVDFDSKDDTVAEAFCSSCGALVTQIYEVYKEFREVELRLSTKLEELGELMMQKPKLGESLSRSLADQLMLKKRGAAYVEHVRNVVAQDLVLRRRKLELELVFDCVSLYEDKNQGCQDEEEEKDPSSNINCEEDVEQVEEVEIKSEVESVVGDADDQPLEMDDSMDEHSSFVDPPSPDKNDKHHDDSKKDDSDDSKNDDSDASYDAAADEIDASESDSDSDVSYQEEFEDSDNDNRKATTKRKKSPNLSTTEAKRKRTTNSNEKEAKPEPETPKYSYNDYIEGPFHCEICDKGYERWQVYWKHLTRFHEEPATEKPIKCQFCWTSYAFQQTYTYHLKSRHEETLTKPVFSCDADFADDKTITTIQLACDQSFMSSEDLNSHLRTHSEKIHHCSTCNWGFLSPHMLELHTLSHIRSNRGNFTCHQCGIVSTSFAKFKDHYNLRHGAKLLFRKCPLPDCTTSCISRIALQTHIKNHETGKITPARPHVSSGPQVCDLCGIKYHGAKADEMLQRHMRRIHSGAEIICSICQQVFTFGIHYDRHMKSVHKISKLTCEVCKKELGSTRRLKEHMNIVHAAQPESHLCQFCGSDFKSYCLDAQRAH